MICHFKWRINTLLAIFWDVPFEALYEKLLELVRTRRIKFYMPSSELYCKADGYILWGNYSRESIVDIQRIKREDGSYDYREVIIEDFHVQRILDKETGTTHAILNELMTPYKHYSLRCVLYHLSQFFKQPVTQEEYCLDSRLEIKTFRAWLKWLKDNSSLLFGLGLTQSYRDNWQAMRQWIQNITGNVFEWTGSSLRKLNLALFQEHRMPANSAYRNYDSPG